MSPLGIITTSLCFFGGALSAAEGGGGLLTRGRRVRSQECAPLLSIGPDGDWHSHQTWKAILSPEVRYALLIVVCVEVALPIWDGGNAERKPRHPSRRSQVRAWATYQFWPRVASPLQSWVRAAGIFSTRLNDWPVTWYDWDGMSQRQWESQPAHPSRWRVGECELNADSRGGSFIILCYCHIQEAGGGGRNHGLHWRRSNGSIWSCLLCVSAYPPTAGFKAVCVASPWHRDSLWYGGNSRCTERRADAKVPLSKSVGAVSFNR